MGFLNKDRFIFDPADLAQSDQIGSYIIGASGTVVGNVSDALKVNIANASITVSGTDIDIRDLVFATDKVDVSGSEVSLDSATLAALENITVSATDLDIRNLVFATDKVDVSGSSVTVTATDLDIRDLTHVSDSIQIGDGTDLLAVNADGSINVNLTDDGVADDAVDTGNPFKVGGRAYASGLAAVTAGDRVNLAMDLYRRLRTFVGAQVGILTTLATVDDTAAVIVAALAGRQKIIIQNTSNKDIFVGGSTVTVANGVRIAKGATMELDIGEVALYAIAATDGNDVRVLELA